MQKTRRGCDMFVCMMHAVQGPKRRDLVRGAMNEVLKEIEIKIEV